MQKQKIKNIIELWKQEKKTFVKMSTYSAYVAIINNHILPYFGELFKVTENHVQDFALNKIEQGLKHKTIKDIIVVLKMILKFGAKAGYFNYIDINIKFPTSTTIDQIDVFSKQEYKKLVEYVVDNFSFKNLGIYICLLSGLRIGEICGLKWEDVDVQDGLIKIERTIQRVSFPEGTPNNRTQVITSSPKTINSVRQVPISAMLAKTLKPLKRVVNDDFYIITNTSRPIEPKSYRNYYNALLKRIGLQKHKFHALRHSFATRCIESNCDYKTVSSILGHSSISTTLNLYVHPDLEQKKRCVEQMWKRLK